MRPRTPFAATLAALSLLGFVAAAGAGDDPATDYAERKADLLDDVREDWPEEAARADWPRVEQRRTSVATLLDGLERMVQEHKFGSTEQRWVDDLRVDVAGAEKPLTTLATTHGAAETLAEEMVAFGHGVSHKALPELVERASGKPEEVVRKEFRGVKNAGERVRTEQAKKMADATRALEEVQAWRPRSADLEPLREEVATWAERTVHALEDAWDRVFEDDPGVKALFAGDSTDLFQLCVQGRTAEALAHIKSWKPVRLDVADIAAGAWIPRESNWIDLIAHGGPESVTIQEGSTKFRTNHQTLFEYLKKRLTANDLAAWQRLNDDLGVGVRLISCSTGEKPDGIAQKLANLLGVRVKAPSTLVRVVSYGSRVHVVLHECPQCDGPQPDDPAERTARALHVLRSKDRGRWKIFTPNDEADQKVKADLFKLATEQPWWQVAVTQVRLKKGIPETLAALEKLNSKLDEDDVQKALTEKRPFVALEGLTRKAALDKADDVGALGLTVRVEVMPRHKDKFRNVKTE